MLVGSGGFDVIGGVCGAFGRVDVTKPEVTVPIKSSMVYDGRGQMVEGNTQAEALEVLISEELAPPVLKTIELTNSVLDDNVPVPLASSMV